MIIKKYGVLTLFVAILNSKLRKAFPKRFLALKIKGFSYWRRSQRKLKLPEVEFEEQMENATKKFRNSLTIAKHLQRSFLKIVKTHKNSQNVPKVEMYYHCLSIENLKRPHRHKVKSGKEDVVVNISSYRNISSCITGKRMEQVALDSDSDTEMVNGGVKSLGYSREYVEYDETEIEQERGDIEYISSDSEIGGDEVIPLPPSPHLPPPILSPTPEPQRMVSYSEVRRKPQPPVSSDVYSNFFGDPNPLYYLLCSCCRPLTQTGQEPVSTVAVNNVNLDIIIQYKIVYQKNGEEASVMIDKSTAWKDFVDIFNGGEIPVKVLIKCCAFNCKAKLKPKNFLKHLKKVHQLCRSAAYTKNGVIVTVLNL